MPARRAVLAGTVETAVNALWDAAPLIGDRVAVVGAGMVGCWVAAVLTRFPGAQVSWWTSNPDRAEVAAALGVDFALPADAAGDCDLVVHASATSAGLQPGARAARPGRHRGGAQLVRRPPRSACRSASTSTPAGSPSAAARSARSPRPGAAAAATPTGWRLALDLLADPAFDVLITGESRFDDLPDVLPRLGRRQPAGTVPPGHLPNSEECGCSASPFATTS